jgi:hypothetical protein
MSTTINHEQFVIDGDYQTSVQKLEAVAAAVPAFTILGKKTNDGAVTRTAVVVAAGAGTGGANTGTGTLVKDATAPILAGAEDGAYLIKCKSAATSNPAAEAVFEVFSPDGGLMGQINAGTDGEDVWSNRIKFAITDHATGDGKVPFAAGDAFTFTVATTQEAASGELAAWDPTKTDGSEVPYGILAAEAPKNEAAQYVSVYISGKFNADKVVVPTDVDVDTVFDALRDKGIYLIHQADTERNPAVVEE